MAALKPNRCRALPQTNAGFAGIILGFYWDNEKMETTIEGLVFRGFRV